MITSKPLGFYVDTRHPALYDLEQQFGSYLQGLSHQEKMLAIAALTLAISPYSQGTPTGPELNQAVDTVDPDGGGLREEVADLIAACGWLDLPRNEYLNLILAIASQLR